MKGALEKFDKIFEQYPWIKEAKNIVHVPFTDGNDPKRIKTLPGVSWKELAEILDYIKERNRS